MPTVRRPVKVLASAVAKCGPVASAYGKCVTLDYNDVHKNLCEKEFMAFKECVTSNMKKR